MQFLRVPPPRLPHGALLAPTTGSSRILSPADSLYCCCASNDAMSAPDQPTELPSAINHHPQPDSIHNQTPPNTVHNQPSTDKPTTPGLAAPQPRPLFLRTSAIIPQNEMPVLMHDIMVCVTFAATPAQPQTAAPSPVRFLTCPFLHVPGCTFLHIPARSSLRVPGSPHAFR